LTDALSILPLPSQTKKVKTMKKNLFRISVCALLMASATMAMAQEEQQKQDGKTESQETRSYRQANKVKKAFGLDSKQFNKVYSAYKKYNDAVENAGKSKSSQGGFGGPGMGGPGGGPGMGGPGGGFGGPQGGMGGPGGGPGMGGQQGGMPQGGGFGGPQGGGQKKPAAPDMEARKKVMDKQEKKLCKTMRKVLKDDDKYAKWTEIRQQQLMPPHPQGNGPRPEGPQPGGNGQQPNGPQPNGPRPDGQFPQPDGAQPQDGAPAQPQAPAQSESANN
jgi:hypothetical protein